MGLEEHRLVAEYAPCMQLLRITPEDPEDTGLCHLLLMRSAGLGLDLTLVADHSEEC